MTTDSDRPIGQRLRRMRDRRGLTQEVLAERSGVSVDLIRKLEQGQRHSARMSSLTALATALDVELSWLLAQPATLGRHNDEPASILAIREAITAVAGFPGIPNPEQAEPTLPDLDMLAGAVRHAQTVRQHGSFTELGGLLPSLLAEARSATRAYEAERQRTAFGLLAETLQIAATMTTALGREDLGYLAMVQAQHAADRAEDDLLAAGNVAWLSWILLKQGRLEEAERVAVVTAERIEPDFVRGGAAHLGVWGILLLRGASAAVRANRPDRAEELHRLASAAAVRLDRDLDVYATPFGPTNAGVAAVNAAVEAGRFSRALKLAARVPEDGWVSPTWRARYLVDLAIAQAETRQEPRAIASLLAAEQLAPEWMRYHTLARSTVLELAERGRRRSQLWQLANRLRIEV